MGRLTRLLLLNGIFMALWATREATLRDLQPVWEGLLGSSDAQGSAAAAAAAASGSRGSSSSGSSGRRSAPRCPSCGDVTLLTSAGGGVRGARNISGDGEISFNVIMTSVGDRPTLQSALESIMPQLRKEDYLTLISDANHLTIAETFAYAPCNCTKLLIQNSKPLGWWGHGSRTRWQKLLPGTYHMNADDDDLYPPNAMSIVRHWVRDLNSTLYVFRMIRRWDQRIEVIPPMWVNNGSVIRGGLVGTPCAVYRAVRDELPDWSGRYGGDGDFYVNLVKAMHKVVVVPEVIYHVGQREDLMPWAANLTRGLLAEPEEDVAARVAWRKWNPDAPPQFLPAPAWGGQISYATTGWEPPEDAPQPREVLEERALAAQRALEQPAPAAAAEGGQAAG